MDTTTNENPFRVLGDRLSRMEVTLEEIKTKQKHTTQSEPNRLMSRKQVRDHYNISYPTIHRLMQIGSFPFIKEGRKTLFRQSDLDKYFENKTTVL